MNRNTSKLHLLAATIAPLLVAAMPAAGHTHFTVGVAGSPPTLSPAPDSPLGFVGENPEQRVFRLLARPFGNRVQHPCGGYYMLSEKPRTLFPGDAFSITALSSGIVEEAEPGHAHPGALIVAEIVSVTGPPGGFFGFWESGRSSIADTPSASFPTNADFAPFPFPISEGTDAAGEDPQGHIHGRCWTATKPGTYRLGIRFTDISTNRPGAMPWHPPSRTYLLTFVAGPSFQPTCLHDGTAVTISWASQMGTWDAGGQSGITFTIQRSSSLQDPDWTPLATVVGTTAPSISFRDESPSPGRAFYRVTYDWAPPP